MEDSRSGGIEEWRIRGVEELRSALCVVALLEVGINIVMRFNIGMYDIIPPNIRITLNAIFHINNG